MYTQEQLDKARKISNSNFNDNQVTNWIDEIRIKVKALENLNWSKERILKALGITESDLDSILSSEVDSQQVEEVESEKIEKKSKRLKTRFK